MSYFNMYGVFLHYDIATFANIKQWKASEYVFHHGSKQVTHNAH